MTSIMKRPREKAIASSNESWAGRSTASRLSTLPWRGCAAKVRATVSARIVIGCEVVAALVRPIDTVRLARSQRNEAIGCVAAGPKAA